MLRLWQFVLGASVAPPLWQVNILQSLSRSQSQGYLAHEKTPTP